MELAHGSRVGYVKGDTITFVEDDVSEEQKDVPKIISLGRLVKNGALLEWTDRGANLKLPDDTMYQLAVVNNCPYANPETVKAIQKFQKEIETKKLRKNRVEKAYKAFKLRIKTQKELDEHRRGGHAKYS